MSVLSLFIKVPPHSKMCFACCYFPLTYVQSLTQAGCFHIHLLKAESFSCVRLKTEFKTCIYEMIL